MSEKNIEKEDMMERTEINRSWFLIVAAVALSGASALIYEVIGSRVLEMFSNGSLISITTVLIIFLGGIALGAGLMAELKKRNNYTTGAFVTIQLVIALYCSWILTQFNLLPELFDLIDRYVSSQIAALFIGGLFYILIPAILLGSVFPLATALIADKSISDISRRLGWLYSLDVLGAVIGAALAGYWLIPHYGLVITLLSAAALNIIASLILINIRILNVVYWTAAVMILIIGIYIFVPYKTNYSITRDYQKDETQTLNFNENEILYKTSSPYGLVTVREERWNEGGLNRIMAIGERDQCQSKASASEQRLAEATMSGFKESAEVLHIGLGCGFTLQKILEYSPASVDVSEINRVVPSIADLWFGELNNQAVRDPRVNIIVDDGAEVIRTGKDKYDAIIIDIENPTIAHSSPLYTLEYFRYANNILNPGGRLALWGYHSEDYRYLKSLVTTLESIYEHVAFFQDNAYILIASQAKVDITEFDVYDTYENLVDEISRLETVSMNTIDQPILETFYKP